MSGESQRSKDAASEDSFDGYFEACTKIVAEIGKLAESLESLAIELDPVGAEELHGEGSPARRLAELRDHADFCLFRVAEDLRLRVRVRADVTRSVDLLANSVSLAMGDGDDCLKLIETYHLLMGDDTEGTGVIDAESFPDQFLWDLAQRVEAFPAFAERYSKHLYFAARHLQGLPMMISHHIDISHDFEKLSGMLRMGSMHPLDVAPRTKRGGRTPSMIFLEPLIYRLNTLREVIQGDIRRNGEEPDSDRINWLWTYSYSVKTPQAVIDVLRGVLNLGPLTKKTALQWSKEVVVPYIMLTEGAAPADSSEPFVRNIWAHRSVKSPATFRSRLERAVTDFLNRYGREDEGNEDL